MRILEGLGSLEGPGRDAWPTSGIESRSAILVGVFDGVHLGHQRLLHELGELSSSCRALPTVVTFRNHPDEILHGRKVDWIVSLPHRLRLLRRAGIGRVLLLDFDQTIRDLTARAFTERVLVHGLHAAAVLLGYDSALGRGRDGDLPHLQALGDEFDFVVRQGSRFLVDGEAVSSTAIRRAIRSGDLALAHRMLGRWPQAFGEVVRGDGRGHELGFPTANIVPQSLVLPPAGVYAVEALVDGDTRPGVANLGSRPTFTRDPAQPPLLEVHLLDLDRDLYGNTLEVSFVARIRDERRFAGADELRTQITRDIATARDLLRI
ncbi:MAG: riboflavin biosynthesis protein RibF [Planctomycetota bacterium]